MQQPFISRWAFACLGILGSACVSPDDEADADELLAEAAAADRDDALAAGDPAAAVDPGAIDDLTAAPGGHCRSLGGRAGVTALIGDLRAIVRADERIDAYLHNADVDDDRVWSCADELLATIARCDGATYSCASTAEAFAGLGVSGPDYADFLEDFAHALQARPGATTLADRAELVATLAGMAEFIVEDADGDGTLYQRLGRKPGIKAVVGAPGQAGTFLDRVAADPAIAGFFAAADMPRLGTCLTRQIAAIDGPIRYGLEVDAPAGVDPGVGLAHPCRSMAAAHADVVDAELEGITVADFLVVLTDLQQALDGAGVDGAERDAVLAALTPMCAEIVGDPDACDDLAQTEVLSAPKLYMPIPDDAYDGTLDSMYCHAFTVAADGIDRIADVRLRLAIAHPFVGDLVIKVQVPDQRVLNVMTRPGFVEPLDNGWGGPGDSSSLVGVQPVEFADDAPFSAEYMGAKIGLGQPVCIADDECAFMPSPGKGPGVDFASFAGADGTGTWRVCVGDARKGAAGSVNAITLTIDQRMGAE